MQTLKINDTTQGGRLDVFVHENMPELSRASVQKLIHDGKILVNGKQEKTGYKLKVGDKTTIDFDIKSLSDIPEIDLPVLYEDDDCIVIDKPAGVLSHSKGAFNPEATVASFIAPKLQKLSGDRGGIVHRLDRATSGVIICAKNEAAEKWLQKQFSSRKVKKVYVAVVDGAVEPPEAIIDMPIARNTKSPKQFIVSADGKKAVTHYKVTQQADNTSLLELRPETGRTHQLRVHLKHIKHPIVGDILYGGSVAPRMMLHAKSLEITLPNKERKTFVSPVPAEFEAIMK